MPFEGGDRASSSASNAVSRTDTAERHEDVGHLIQMEACSIPTPLRPPSTQYVLNPSPSFDPVFDDLLEGGSGTATSVIRECASTSKSDNPSVDETTRKIEYLNELLRDEKSLKNMPDSRHLHKLIRREIERVRSELRISRTPVARVENVIQPERPPNGLGQFSLGASSLREASSSAPLVTAVEKVYPPVDEYPDYNFIGRLIGPRGRTVRQIEHETGCQVTVRGRGSENKGRQFQNREQRVGGTEETEPLHVRIEAAGPKGQAEFIVRQAKELVQKLLIPVDDDELKQRQLRELAVLRRGGRWQQQSFQLSSVNPPMPGHFPTYAPPPTFQFIPAAMISAYPNMIYHCIDAPSMIEESATDTMISQHSG